MTLRLPDNLMARPMLPGVLGDGTENVTRQFGNRSEQISAAPNIPNGFGGAVNPAAGVENQVAAKTAETVAHSISNTVDYLDNLRTAEEDSRSKLMMLDIDKEEAEIRKRLDADPEYAKKSTTDQQTIYETERDAAIDRIYQGYSFNQPKVVKNVQDTLAQYKARSSEVYVEKYVKPRVVAQSRIVDQTADSAVIDKVVTEPTATNVAEAIQNITERYDSPQAYATYGATTALALKVDALNKLKEGARLGFIETVNNGPLNNLDKAIGKITIENAKEGPISAIIADEKGKWKAIVDQMPISEKDKLVLLNKGEKNIDQIAEVAIKTHNGKIKEDARLAAEGQDKMLTSWSNSLRIGVRDGSVTEKVAFQQFQQMMEHPSIKDDPKAQARVINAYERVSEEIDKQRKHREKMDRERNGRNNVTQERIENGITVSGPALDALWQKDGNVDRFYKNGNLIDEEHLAVITKAGAVPTTITGSIEHDLRSSNPEEQKRGVTNLMRLKNYNSQTQQALYRQLGDGWAEVIHRIGNGQDPQTALASMNRPRPTPDIEKKLKNEAANKTNTAYGVEALKKAGFDPDKMSVPMKAEAQEMWRAAYSRANGDHKLAQEIYRQDLSKLRSWGVSKFSDKTETYPLTNFTGSKEVATDLIVEAIPEAKGKDVVPYYVGMITLKDGSQVPGYEIRARDENGLMVPLNKTPFYVTKEHVATAIEKRKEAELQAQIAKAEKYKNNLEAWKQHRDAHIKGKPSVFTSPVVIEPRLKDRK